MTETYCDKFTGLSLFIQPTHFWLNYAVESLAFKKKAQIRGNHSIIGTWHKIFFLKEHDQVSSSVFVNSVQNIVVTEFLEYGTYTFKSNLYKIHGI